MLKAQGFGLNATSNPSFTLTARDVDLNTIAALVVVNQGPGAALVYAGAAAAGTPLEIVGGNQRKMIVVGGTDAFTIALPTPVVSGVLANLYQNGANGSVVACDDYSLIGTSDYARGETGMVFINPAGASNGLCAATDIGFDRFRGIYVPPQASPPTIYGAVTGSYSTNWPLIGPPGGTSMDVSLSEIGIAWPNVESFFVVSDQPIIAG